MTKPPKIPNMGKALERAMQNAMPQGLEDTFRQLDVNVTSIQQAGILKAKNDARLAGRFGAEEVFIHLQNQIRQFEANLEDIEEVGIQLANFGSAAEIHIRTIGYENPNLITFHGVNPDNNKVELIQHISQLNFMLVAVKPIEDTAYRIGFFEPKENMPTS